MRRRRRRSPSVSSAEEETGGRRALGARADQWNAECVMRARSVVITSTLWLRAAAAAAFQTRRFCRFLIFGRCFFLSSPSFPVARANVRRRIAALQPPSPYSRPPEPACVCCKFNPRRRDSSFLSGMLLGFFFFAPCFPVSSCLMSAVVQQINRCWMSVPSFSSLTPADP